jgi:molecular chaperone DnaK
VGSPQLGLLVPQDPVINLFGCEILTELAVGIDLGTTNSAVACVNDRGIPEVIRNSYDETITPSVIVFTKSGEVLVGKEAKQTISPENEDIAWFFKRDMGTDTVVTFQEKEYTPIDLSALLLHKLKTDAESAIGRTIRKAVITVPAYFENRAREDTKKAAELAGLEVLNIINEPTAAALAYGAGNQDRKETVLVYDLGGGTFDISLVEIEPSLLRVVGTDGNHNLGGKDWDDRLLNHVCEEFERRHGTDPRIERYSFQEILRSVEDLKKGLSAREKVTVQIRCGGISDKIEVTRFLFEELTNDLLGQTEILIQKVLEDTGYRFEQISQVLMVGGSTRMPMCKSLIRRLTGKEPNQTLNPDECVALGAAIQAGLEISRCENSSEKSGIVGLMKIQDVTAHSLGMVVISADGKLYENAIILAKNSPIPSEDSQVKVIRTSPRKENQLEVYLLQGESQRPLDTTILGKYTFHDIPHYSGETRIIIKFRYDANGIVQIEAFDEQSGTRLRGPTIENRNLDISWTDKEPELQYDLDETFIVLCIDVSGSMHGRKLEAAKAGALNFMKNVDPEYTSVGLVSFGSNAKRRMSFTRSIKDMQQAVKSLSLEGSTAMGEGLDLACEDLKQVNGRRVIVVLTDGSPDDQDETLSIAEECRMNKIEIITIGTDDADLPFLRQLATSDMNQFITSARDIGVVFGKIARNLSDERMRIRK